MDRCGLKLGDTIQTMDETQLRILSFDDANAQLTVHRKGFVVQKVHLPVWDLTACAQYSQGKTAALWELGLVSGMVVRITLPGRGRVIAMVRHLFRNKPYCAEFVWADGKLTLTHEGVREANPKSVEDAVPPAFFYEQIRSGHVVDCRDRYGKWCTGTVLAHTSEHVKIGFRVITESGNHVLPDMGLRFFGFGKQYDEAHLLRDVVPCGTRYTQMSKKHQAILGSVLGLPTFYPNKKRKMQGGVTASHAKKRG